MYFSLLKTVEVTVMVEGAGNVCWLQGKTKAV